MSSMNFLALVQRAHQESGIGGTPPSSVVSQTGRAADAVRWVQSAHEEIQNLHTDWNFDWAQGSFTLTSGDDSYVPATDWSVTGGVREFVRRGAYVYDPAVGVNSRTWLDYREWDAFRELLIPAVPGTPVLFSLDPDGNVRFYPRPDRTLTAVMEYARNPQELAANTDVPRIPAKFHMVIVWKAVQMWAEWMKDWSLEQSANKKYSALRDRMEIECRPRFIAPGALA